MKVTDPSSPETLEIRPLKRVLYVITKANWGGAQRYVFQLATGARERGYDVLVVAGRKGVLTQKLQEAGIRVETIERMERDIRITAEMASFRSLMALIKEFNPDIIHANSSKAGGLAALAGRLCGIPHIIFTAHAWAYNEDRSLLQKVVIGLFHFATVLLAHRTICVSEAVRAQASWMPCVQTRLSVVHAGIEPEVLLPRIEARERLAPEFARKFPNRLWIGTVAELHPTKGLDILIRAFAKLPDSPVLVIAGSGQELGHLEKLVQTEDVTGRVHFAGFVDGAPATLPAFDIFVLPSRSEAFGMVLLEAGLAALPVVASDVGGIPEIIKNEESGLLVPAGDVDALTNALSTLMKSEDARTVLGNALYERVTRVFTQEKMLRETFDLYTAPESAP